MRTLRAGAVWADFDGADLRYVRMAGVEVLRHVYFAVRDRNWSTLRNEISGFSLTEEAGGFLIEYDAVSRAGGIEFAWHASIAGCADGSITWTAHGQALTSFLKNRIGWCVLHPVQGLAGNPCEVEHTSGELERGVFPRYVAPRQPFRDIAAVRHTVLPGVAAEVRFEGDVFEMEDHRNWSDASYKIYSTPLHFPFPAPVGAGERIGQSVMLRFVGALPEPAASADGAVRIEVQGDTMPLPEIGYGCAGEISRDALPRLRALRPTHLRVDLRPASGDWRADLAGAASAAIPLECAMFLSDSASSELEAVSAEIRRHGVPVRRWLMFQPEWLELARHLLPAAEFAIGTNANFAELNRARFDTSWADAVCFSINPQVHGFDDATLVENLAAQAAVVESARRIAPAKRVAVTPVTLKPRFNVVATDPDPSGPPSDSRQKTWFAAAWTLGSLKYLAESGASSATYYEIAGPRGLMDEQGAFPVYDLLTGIVADPLLEVVRSRSSHPLAVEALALRRRNRVSVLLANFSGAERRVDLPARSVLLPPSGWEEFDL